jgi:hypothetical protein
MATNWQVQQQLDIVNAAIRRGEAFIGTRQHYHIKDTLRSALEPKPISGIKTGRQIPWFNPKTGRYE